MSAQPAPEPRDPRTLIDPDHGGEFVSLEEFYRDDERRRSPMHGGHELSYDIFVDIDWPERDAQRWDVIYASGTGEIYAHPAPHSDSPTGPLGYGHRAHNQGPVIVLGWVADFTLLETAAGESLNAHKDVPDNVARLRESLRWAAAVIRAAFWRL